MEELIDILDETGRKTGESLPRNEVHKKGLWQIGRASCMERVCQYV